MQPPQNDLRCPSAKDTSITHAAAAPSNLDAAITMRSAETEMQNTKELYAQRRRTLQLQNRIDLAAKATKRRFEARFRKNFIQKITNTKIQKPS